MNYELIDKLIKENNLTRSGFAKEMKYSTTGFIQTLTRKTMKVEMIEEIASYFNISVSCFFSETDAETYKSHIDIPYTNEPIPPYSGKIKICRDPVCIAEREILKEQIDKLKDKIIELHEKYDELRKQEGGAPPGKRDVGGMEQPRPTGTDG